MDPEKLAASTTKPAPRKMRFAPKPPPKREQKTVLPKVEKTEDDIDDAMAEQLLRQLNESSLSGRPKVEKKVKPTQVAFGFGGGSSSLMSYNTHKKINKIPGSSSDGDALAKEYKEPWDYYTNYPVILPLRRPYSGNPELLDKEEFNEDPQSSVYDESTINPALDLGLLEENPENDLFFVQLPSNLPTIKHESDNQDPAKGGGKSQKLCNLEKLPAGLMGKMLVYRSGAVKLKLGDTLYDVSPGLNCVFAQDAFAINTEDKQCCNMGELSKRAVIAPDVESMLDSISDDL